MLLKKGKEKIIETVEIAGKKPVAKKNKKLEFVTPSIADVVVQPTLGAKRSLKYWLGG